MTAWILIGYLTYGASSMGGGPFVAEFATEQACRSAIEQIVQSNRLAMPTWSKRAAICVPKGAPQ